MGYWDTDDFGKQKYNISMADLAQTLDTLPGYTMIDMCSSDACLGAQTVARLLPEAYDVEYFYGHGSMEFSNEFIEVAGTNDIEDFIHIACDLQSRLESDGLSVTTLRDMISQYIH